MKLNQLIRPHLQHLIPYSSARDEYTGDTGVFLDANENALGSLAGEGWNRYPDPYQKKIKMKISDLKDVHFSFIFLGNGSDEPIDLLIRAFCEPGKDAILISSPTYGMYKVSANIHNVRIIDCPLTPDYQLDTEKIVDHLKDVKLTFICSPNNPTGNIFDKKAIKTILEKSKGLVIVDEAYIDFTLEESWVSELKNYENLVVLQTFSKAWGMAGLRVGMAFANPELVSILNKIKPPYNISGPVQKLISSALDHSERKNEWVSHILAQRNDLAEKLTSLSNVVKVYPSDANFLLVRFTDARSVFDKLIHDKVIVRDRSKVHLCDNSLRITVGTVEENELLMKSLKSYE